ncbi:MAG: hypothetical protein AAF682_04545 [Planctomycetota bacterium]
MTPTFYYILHVVAGFLLTAFTFQAFAAPDPARRKKTLMLTGILGLVMLVAGFGLLAKLQLSFSGWVIIKLVCWLGLMAISGMAFRKPQSAGVFTLAGTALVAVAIWAVYAKPF